MATVTFTDVGAAEWVVPARVHSIRAKMRSGGGAAGIGGMGGHYFEITCSVIPGDSLFVTAAGAQESDSANRDGSAAQIVLGSVRYGQILLKGGWTYKSDVAESATGDNPDPRGFPYVEVDGESNITGLASNMLYSADRLFYRGGLGVTAGGGGSGANSTGPGVDAVGSAGGLSGGDGGDGGDVGLAGEFPGGGPGAGTGSGAGATITLEYFESHGEDEMAYLGRVQQGTELIIVLQCTDDYNTPENPSHLPWVQIYLDAPTPELIASKQIPAEARRVEDGIFRLSLFLDTLYTTEGRYLVLMKWLDLNGVAHVRTGCFHLLPGGNPDGTVISMHSLIRQDATYLIMQHDSGRIVRKRNPR